MEAHREAYREVLRWIEQAAAAAERGDVEGLREALRRGEQAMEAMDRLPPLSLPERAALRKEVLPLLEAALSLNRGMVTLLSARRARLAQILVGGPSRFVDTWG